VAATPAISDTLVLLPQLFGLYSFGAGSGNYDWLAGIPSGLPWTPLIDGNTLITATAGLYVGYYSIVAMDIFRRQHEPDDPHVHAFALAPGCGHVCGKRLLPPRRV
jgi:hypothetical protein